MKDAELTVTQVLRNKFPKNFLNFYGNICDGALFYYCYADIEVW